MTSVPARPARQQGLAEKVLLRLVAAVLILAGLAAMVLTATGHRL